MNSTVVIVNGLLIVSAIEGMCSVRDGRLMENNAGGKNGGCLF